MNIYLVLLNNINKTDILTIDEKFAVKVILACSSSQIGSEKVTSITASKVWRMITKNREKEKKP